ncbi:integral membrane protein [Nannizzia gypsea CBS 118893]|uniref:Integral membrane protein n=1 Tax=Arthroderma gypseum (strain ATCC MYA-4604 / CBS 118893) TaxID=535722 RepID=E4UXL9_ARTGP|nr:integral membrane protein [Nannizzia gypsea CBS 118893]EFR02753.1 integral membrane protein [Nannizzia gypsea CBS 118893]
MSVTTIELAPPVRIHDTPKSSQLVLQALGSSTENVTSHGVHRGPDDSSDEEVASTFSVPPISRAKVAVIIVSASSMVLMNSVLTGILTVGLPVIAADIGLADSLLLWPASVYGLTCGCTLLLSGSLADVIGSRPIYLAGCGILSAFTLGCGLVKTGIQLIMFRAMSGIAMSLCLPSAVSIITAAFAPGGRRNIAFACLGAAQPVGFSLGIVLGGVLIASIGWRYGYYIVAGVNVLVLIVAYWQIPTDPRKVVPVTWKRLTTEIDWVGTLLISASLGLFSYALSTISVSIRELAKPGNAVTLALSVVCLAGFVYWIHRQERLGRVAMVPPKLFKSTANAPRRARNFTCVCISVFFTWALFNSFQFFTTLYFQELQGNSALTSSIKYIPMVISGLVTNIVTGFLVKRVSADILCTCAAIASSVAPLLMAIARPEWSYWTATFFATVLIPVSADTLFTVSNLVITSAFPPRTHGLAGGVFNTISQIGMSVGIAITAVASNSVIEHELPHSDRQTALLKGYRATYWISFGAAVTMVALSLWGLRSIGKIGLKKE